jgi:hypothetical protein
MQPLTPVRTVTAAAAVALAGLLAAAPQASAAIGAAALHTPHVADDGANLVVPLDATADQAAGMAMARKVADSLAGTWLSGLIQDATANAAPTAPTCRATVTATDSNGAAGTATEILPAQGAAKPLTIPDQTRGTRWGVGDVDHFTLKMTCTDTSRNSQLSDISVDQDAIAS